MIENKAIFILSVIGKSGTTNSSVTCGLSFCALQAIKLISDIESVTQGLISDLQISLLEVQHTRHNRSDEDQHQGADGNNVTPLQRYIH